MSVLLQLLLCGLLAGCRPDAVMISSSPPQATVWLNDGGILGPTPVEVPLPKSGSLVLRICKPSYADQTIELSATAVPADHLLHVTLAKRADMSIECISTPPGADVYLDGEYQGRAPVTLTGLEARIYEVSFLMKARQQSVQSIDLSDARDTLVVHAELGSLTEAYYLQQIEKEPDLIHNYADLAHHYILEHRLQDAVTTFSQGIEVVVRNPDISDAGRLWSEIDRVIDEQYEYGDPATVRKAREILTASLGTDLRKCAGKEPLMLFISYTKALDSLDRRQEAQDVFETAWRKFPGEKVLIRLGKEKRFAFP